MATVEVERLDSVQKLIEAFNSNAGDETVNITIINKLNLIAISHKEKFAYICAHLKTELLFDMLMRYSNSGGTTSTDNLHRLLSKILEDKPIINVITDYGSNILSSQSVNSAEYQIVCLQQILRLSEEDDAFSMFMSNPEMLLLTISYLGNDKIEIYSLSRKVLGNLFDHSSVDMDWLFSKEVRDSFKYLLNQNSVVKFRVYEVFVDFVSKIPEKTELCESFGIFDDLISELANENDPLVQLNALDLLSKIAVSGPQGLKLLEEKSIVSWVEKIVSSDDPLTNIILPGAIKFYGIIASGNTLDVIPRYRNINNVIFQNLISGDASLKCLCAETIAHIASTSTGLKVLYSNPDQMKFAVQCISNIVTRAGEGEHAQRRAAESLVEIFSHDRDDVEVSMICEKLFRQIDESPISYLFKLAQQPFLNLRYSSLRILSALSRYSWAEQDLALFPGFLEYLLDRTTEQEKEGHELKYAIIKNLSTSPTSKDNVGVDFHDKILKYVHQGVFYSDSHVAVTYEREN